MLRIFLLLSCLGCCFANLQRDQISSNSTKVLQASLQVQNNMTQLQYFISTCDQNCGDKIICLSICIPYGDIIGFALGGFFALVLIIILFCMCYQRNLCLFWPCHTYQHLKRNYNVIDPGQIKQQQFEQICDKILNNFKFSEKHNNYTYKSEYGTHEINCTKIKSKKVKRFLRKFYLEGKDNLSQFNAHGYITCRKGDFFCWLLKIYKSKQKSGQTGGYQNLVYQSTKIYKNGKMEGKHYYVGFENIARLWKLQIQQQALISACTQIVHSSSQGNKVQKKQNLSKSGSLASLSFSQA